MFNLKLFPFIHSITDLDFTENVLLRDTVQTLDCMKASKAVEAQLSAVLLHIYGQLFSQRQSFLLLARNAPMHGLLTSLRTSLKLEPATASDQTFHFKLINELEKSVQFMLQILGRPNASFADMGVAVEQIVGRQSQCGDIKGEVNISEDHSLVLACAWLNIKEACLLSSELRSTSPEVIERAGQLLIKVLTSTRHKGVLEAAAVALSDFCCHLLTSGEHSHFPEIWLNDVIDSLENHAASVTRRSAGLPLLVRSLVSSEERGSSGGRHLLTLAVTKLLAILEKGQSIHSSSSETEDVPQCHALHVLRYVILTKCYLRFF